MPDTLNKELMPHLIRGYFDGDGSINTRAARDQWKIHLVGTLDMINSIDAYLRENKINFPGIHPIKRSTIYEMATTTNSNIINFYNLIYKDATIYLPRKYERFQEFLSTCPSQE
ncbi:hypothetical protein AAAC51_08000 [Priestia megaterium]